MRNGKIGNFELEKQAYAIAWPKLQKRQDLTPDEIRLGPDRLHWYIQIMIEIGERDPNKIAKAVLGMLGQYEQILHSKACIECEMQVASTI